MSWDNLWAYFKAATNEIKMDIWMQLDLERHLKGIPPKVQIEVLKNAPADVLGLVKNHISLEARNKLGFQRTIRIRL